MYNTQALFFPTKIILIDDDPSFLKTLGLKLSENFLVETYEDPRKALDNIRESQSKFSIMDPAALLDENQSDQDSSSLNLAKINSIVANQEKYSLVTVVIVDYLMPSMNGIEFLEQVSDFPIMKILLTGNADLQLALDAFNRGVVDKFLVKNSKK